MIWLLLGGVPLLFLLIVVIRTGQPTLAAVLVIAGAIGTAIACLAHGLAQMGVSHL